MEIPGRVQLATGLLARQGAIAEAWRRAIAQTSFVPLSSAELRSRLFDLTGRAIALLFGEPFDTAGAEQIGTALAQLHCTQPEALGRTQALLMRELLENIPPDQIPAMLAPAGSLMEGLAVGFGRETCGTLLREQESIRQALLVTLRATEQRLREARDHLDEQVRERTRELQESEEKYRELLEEIDAAVLTVDREGRITYASPPVGRLFGRQPVDVLGKHFAEFIHPPDVPHVRARFAKVLEGIDSSSEFRIPAAGGFRWAHAATRAVFDGDRVVGAHGVITDITERKQAEEALRESEERWRTLLDNSPDPVITLDREGRVLFVNDVRPESGLTLQDVLGQPAVDRALPEQMQAAMAALDRIFDAGDRIVQEVAVRRPDGSVVWYACHVGPIWQKGQVVAALAVARDVTQEKRIEAALQESEERWRTLVTSAPDVIFLLAPGGRIVYVNHFPADSPFAAQAVVGRYLHELTVPDLVETGKAMIQEVFATGSLRRMEVQVPRASGSNQWYSALIGPLWQGGDVTSAIVIARDITERRRLEEMKDNLLRDVSHQLRTPLARAQMSLELALTSVERSPIDGPNAIKYGRQALDNISSLASTVLAILDLSRLEAGVGAFARETIDLYELVEFAAGEAGPVLADKGLDLVVRVQEGLPQVRGDRERLWSVVHNLLDNAAKFSPSGQIVLSAGVQDGEIVVSVRDDGCGILPENLERVFGRFFREETASDGVGVGLPMCRTIIQAHGGRIWAESGGRGRGATFIFALPVLEQESVANLE